MAEYLIQGETLTELGDKIRVLSGTEDTLTPSQMTSNVQTANNEVDAQSALIDQLSVALEGKASSGGSEVEVETCTITFDNDNTTNDCEVIFVTAMVFEDGKYKTYTYASNVYGASSTPSAGSIFKITIPNVVCGTKINLISCFDHFGYNQEPYVEISGSATFDSWQGISAANYFMYFTFTAPTVANENCTIYYAYNA